MPHASGGGSHSGGSHHSSGSSHRSSGGSHSGGSHSSWHSSGSSFRSSYTSHSSSSTRYNGKPSYSAHRSYETKRRVPHTSTAPFSGAAKYVYYRDKAPHYIYSDHATFKPSRHIGKMVFWLIMALLFFTATFSVSKTPERIKPTYDHKIIIEDSLNILKNREGLEKQLQDFYDKTGITACVITEPNENWQKHYRSLESRAYDLYVNHFTDEYHWLIVYTQPAEADDRFNDWYWEAIQGDYTDSILTEEAVNTFVKSMQRYLTSSLYTPDRAMIKAFSELTPTLMKPKSNSAATIFIGLSFTALFVYLACRNAGITKKKAATIQGLPTDATPVSSNAKEILCSYCGGVYLSERNRCPHCGAAKTSTDL